MKPDNWIQTVWLCDRILIDKKKILNKISRRQKCMQNFSVGKELSFHSSHFCAVGFSIYIPQNKKTQIEFYM